jgi:uncharacterized membrane protein
MTTIIDHAISIPVPHPIVWEQVSSPDYFPRWMIDCRRMAYLTTVHRGKGTRLRCTSAARKEYVMEITAWYEGLGFEYRIVDGSAFDDNRGRIRLQEVAEGTIVQWTFTYEIGGVLGGLRNSMGMKRTIDNQIVDSLRNLYRYIKDTAGEDSVKIVKSLMQDAPSVEQRAKYKPRHPSRFNENPPESDNNRPPTSPGRTGSSGYFRPIIEEPLITDEDTRPNRPLRTEERPVAPEAPAASLPTVSPAPVVEPDRTEKEAPLPSLSSLLSNSPASEIPAVKPETPASSSYAPGIPDLPAASRDFTPFEQKTVEYRPSTKPAFLQEDRPASDPVVPAAPVETPKRVDKKPAASLPVVPEVTVPTPAAETKPSSETVPSPINSTQETEHAPIDPKLDTSKISVFEIFGVPKPSETQQMRAVQLAREIKEQLSAPTHTRLAPVVDPTPVTVSPEEEAERAAFSAGMPSEADVDPEGRRGLRMRQRQHLLALRRPTKKQ